MLSTFLLVQKFFSLSRVVQQFSFLTDTSQELFCTWYLKIFLQKASFLLKRRISGEESYQYFCCIQTELQLALLVGFQYLFELFFSHFLNPCESNTNFLTFFKLQNDRTS